MKLVRYGPAGNEKPGLIDDEGKLRDLSRKVKDIAGDALSADVAERIAKTRHESPAAVKGRRASGPASARVGKFVAIGLNFVDHAKETGSPIPENPIVFFKAKTSISGPNDPIMLPKDSTSTDWEVELAIVIGRRARYVEEKDALRYVAGYCVCNDVSEREYQIKKGGGQWGKGKGCDTFGPLGPWLVTTDEIRDPQNLPMWLKVNGETRQNGSTQHDDLRRRQVVADVSRYMTLEPGDVITTGTPPVTGLPPSSLAACCSSSSTEPSGSGLPSLAACHAIGFAHR